MDWSGVSPSSNTSSPTQACSPATGVGSTKRRLAISFGATSERTRNIASLQNHDMLVDDGPSATPLSSIAAPTLVIHGTADPMFPPDHGEALAEEIPDAQLLLLERAGHGVARVDWETIVRAILEHTSVHPRR